MLALSVTQRKTATNIKTNIQQRPWTAIPIWCNLIWKYPHSLSTIRDEVAHLPCYDIAAPHTIWTRHRPDRCLYQGYVEPWDQYHEWRWLAICSSNCAQKWVPGTTRIERANDVHVVAMNDDSFAAQSVFPQTECYIYVDHFEMNNGAWYGEAYKPLQREGVYQILPCSKVDFSIEGRKEGIKPSHIPLEFRGKCDSPVIWGLPKSSQDSVHKYTLVYVQEWPQKGL